MEKFCEAPELFQVNKKIKKIKSATVVTLTLSIFLMLINFIFVAGFYYYVQVTWIAEVKQNLTESVNKNHEEVNEKIDEKTKMLDKIAGNINQNMTDIVRKVDENHQDLIRIRTTNENVTVKLHQAINKTIDDKASALEKTAREKVGMVRKVHEDMTQMVESSQKTMMDKVTKNHQEIGKIRDDNEKITIELYQVNKTIDELTKMMKKKIENIMDAINESNLYKQRFTLEQNGYCLDTMHRTINGSVGK